MADAPEWSRPIRLDTLGDAPRAIEITADEAERAALARRFGLLSLDAIDATLTLAREGEVVRCEGRLRARAVQACVASGEAVPATVDEPFALRFVPASSAEQADEEVELEPAELDEVTYHGSAVDVGEAVAQTLALGLDPFPRAPEADAALREAGVVGEGQDGPFASLKALRDRL